MVDAIIGTAFMLWSLIGGAVDIAVRPQPPLRIERPADERPAPTADRAPDTPPVATPQTEVPRITPAD